MSERSDFSILSKNFVSVSSNSFCVLMIGGVCTCVYVCARGDDYGSRVKSSAYCSTTLIFFVMLNGKILCFHSCDIVVTIIEYIKISHM